MLSMSPCFRESSTSTCVSSALRGFAYPKIVTTSLPAKPPSVILAFGISAISSRVIFSEFPLWELREWFFPIFLCLYPQSIHYPDQENFPELLQTNSSLRQNSDKGQFTDNQPSRWSFLRRPCLSGNQFYALRYATGTLKINI